MSNFTLFGSKISWKMISLSVPDAMLIGLVIYLIGYLIVFHRYSPKNRKFLSVSYIYYAALIALTIMPLYLPDLMHVSLASILEDIRSIQYIPFSSISSMWRHSVAAGSFTLAAYNMAGNLVLLAPIAILYPNKNRRYHFWNTILTAFLFSVSIEGIQLLGNILNFCSRTVSIDDIILNVIGCALCYGLSKICGWID